MHVKLCFSIAAINNVSRTFLVYCCSFCSCFHSRFVPW